MNRFENHGGRGIKVCERWENSFEAFFADMGKRPSPRHSIDRIDNDGPYSPDNCRWATVREQQGNKRNSLRVTVGGIEKALRHACDEYGVAYKLAHGRLKRGWSIVDAVSRPRARNNGFGGPASRTHSEAQLRIAFAGAGSQTLKMMQARAA